MTAATWPKVVVIPPGARRQWQELREALAVREPPCASDAELWHSRDPSDIKAACDACLSCPAYDSCGAYATVAREVVGVWAGRDRGRRPTPSRPQETT